MIPIVIPTMGAVAKTPIETIKFLVLVFKIEIIRFRSEKFGFDQDMMKFLL